MLKVVVGVVVVVSGAEGVETSEVVSEAVGVVVSESHEVVVEEVETAVVSGAVAVTGAVAVIEVLVAEAEDLEIGLLQETLGTDHHLETLGIGPLLGTLGIGPLLEILVTEDQETALMTDVVDLQERVFHHPGEIPLTEMVEVHLQEGMTTGTGLWTVTDIVVHLKDVAEITPRHHHPGA